MIIIYSMALPAKADAEAFVAFIKDRYFPAVHAGPTRVGQTMAARLLEPHRAPMPKEPRVYFLLVDWAGLDSGGIRIDDEAVEAEFEGFGAVPVRLGVFDEVASLGG